VLDISILYLLVYPICRKRQRHSFQDLFAVFTMSRVVGRSANTETLTFTDRLIIP